MGADAGKDEESKPDKNHLRGLVGVVGDADEEVHQMHVEVEVEVRRAEVEASGGSRSSSGRLYRRNGRHHWLTAEQDLQRAVST